MKIVKKIGKDAVYDEAIFLVKANQEEREELVGSPSFISEMVVAITPCHLYEYYGVEDDIPVYHPTLRIVSLTPSLFEGEE
jgi:hypothetical protein